MSAKLQVYGGSACQRKLARAAVRWFEREWLGAPPRLLLGLNVGFVSRSLAQTDMACVYEEDVLGGRFFQMHVGRGLCCQGELTVTMMHEMMHVKQMLSRDLELNRDTQYLPFWRGRDASHYSYSRQPWERQAYAWEERLALAFSRSEQYQRLMQNGCQC